MGRSLLLTLLLGLWGLVFLPVQTLAVEDGPSISEIEARLADTLELRDLLTYAYESNPSITASRASWNAFIENYRIGKSYPDPQLMTTYFPKPIETRLGPQDWNLTLSQAIPFPGTLSQKGKVLEADAKIARLKLDKTVRDIITSVSRSYYELVYIQTAIEVAGANLDINKQLTAISENAYAEDKALFYDVSKAQAQTAQIRYDIILLQELAQTEKTNLNALLNRPPEAPLGQAVSLPARKVVYALDQIYELASLYQEDILIADQEVEKSGEAVRLARYENLPTFKLGLFYAGIGEPGVATPPKDAGDDALGIQAGLSLPLWFGKNISRTAKARALEVQARAQKQVSINTIRSKISQIWFKLQNSDRLITLYKTHLLPNAMASLGTAETWFREGKGSFSDYLEIQATAYNFQLSLERARADYAKNLARLEQLAGVILDLKRPEADKGDKDQ